MNRINIVFLLFIFVHSRPKDATSEKVKQDIETVGDMILETLVVPSQRIGFCHYTVRSFNLGAPIQVSEWRGRPN